MRGPFWNGFRLSTRLLVVVLVRLVVLALGLWLMPSPAAAATVEAVPPVGPPVTVLRAFDPPASPFGPGHRGVDLSAAQGASVRAPLAGRVTFAGPVAGRGVVVLAAGDLLLSFEPVSPAVAVDAALARGSPLGVVEGSHVGCTQSCLHWGLRQAGRYLNPMLLLRPPTVRLLPWDGLPGERARAERPASVRPAAPETTTRVVAMGGLAAAGLLMLRMRL
jgi:murein DD-endopeptidase MepM/ murein hydrolase activator NlpD